MPTQRTCERDPLLQEIAPKVDSSQFDDLYDAVALRRSGRRSR